MATPIDVIVRLLGGPQTQAQANRVAGSLRNIGQAAEHANTRIQASAASAEPQLAAIGNASTIAASAAGALALAGAGIGLSFNANMEQSEVAFANFLGSADRARAFVADLQTMAKNTPFEMGDLTNSSRLLLAFGFDAEQTKDKLTTIGDAIAGIGGGATEIGQLTRAMGQINAKGRLQGEELLQIQELGLVKQDKLAKALGMTTSEFQKNLEAGKISAEQALPAIDRLLNAKFGGSMEDQSKTFLGQLSTIKDNAKSALGGLTTPLFDRLRNDAFPAVNKMLGGFDAGAVGQKISSTIGTIADQVQRVAGRIGDALAPAAPFANNVLLPLLKGIAKGVIGSIVAAFNVAIPVLKVLMTGLGKLGTFLAPLKGVFEGIGMVVGFVFGGPILKAVGLLGKLGGVFRFIGGAARLLAVPIQFVGWTFSMWLKGLGRIGGAVSAAIAWIGPRFTGAWTNLRVVVAGISGVVGGVATSVLRVGGRIFSALTMPFRRGLSTVGTLIGRIRDRVSTGFASVRGAVGTALGNIAGTVRTVFENALNAAIDTINEGLGLINSLPGVDIGTIGRIGGGGGDSSAPTPAAPGGSRLTPTGPLGLPTSIARPRAPALAPLSFGVMQPIHLDVDGRTMGRAMAELVFGDRAGGAR